MSGDGSDATRRGAVAVVVHGPRLLVIQRSETVRAPGKYCFPGGGIEPGETEAQALVREIREELGTAIAPVRRIWESKTRWGVHLAWWLGELDPATVMPNEAEVAGVYWFTPEEIARLPDLLESNHEFLGALRHGKIEIPLPICQRRKPKAYRDSGG